MLIVGVAVAGGPTLFALPLDHGVDPHLLVWQQGYAIQHVLSATGCDDRLTVTVQVVAHNLGIPTSAPLTRFRGSDPGLVLGPGEEPVKRQRIAAYSIVLSHRGLLATQFSERTAVPGLWGLPGGGVDAGEGPAQAVLREVAEETGQRAAIDHLVDLQTDHWVGRAPNGSVEDFHAVRIIYSASVESPTDPIVHDVGGTTAAATWVPRHRWWNFSWTAGTRQLLDRHLETLAAAG